MALARCATHANSPIGHSGSVTSRREPFSPLAFGSAGAPLVNAAKTARRPLPQHLPPETGKYPPKQIACPDCGGDLKHLGEDVPEILAYVPARFKLIRQARPKLACACCERIVQAEAPSRPIERDVAADCLYLWRRRDLFEEQARNHGVGALGRVGHKDLHMP